MYGSGQESFAFSECEELINLGSLQLCFRKKNFGTTQQGEEIKHEANAIENLCPTKDLIVSWWR